MGELDVVAANVSFATPKPECPTDMNLVCSPELPENEAKAARDAEAVRVREFGSRDGDVNVAPGGGDAGGWPTNLSTLAVASASQFGRGVALSTEMCRSFLHDPSHMFSFMWSSRGPTLSETSAPGCAPVRHRVKRWLDATLEGAVCARNWYEGSLGCSDAASRVPFPGGRLSTVQGLLGPAGRTRELCNARLGVRDEACFASRQAACQRAGYTLLSLRGTLPPWSQCRALEWLLCALTDRLPGQRTGAGVAFAMPPSELDTGYLVMAARRRTPAYRSTLTYYLQACITSVVCSNGDDIWHLPRAEAGRAWHCEINRTAVEQLPIYVRAAAAT